MSIASRLLKANPSVQVSDTLTGDFTIPSRKGDFYTPLSNQFEGLSNTVVTSASATVTLSGLSAFDSYSAFRVMYRLRGTDSNENGVELYVRWNGISTSTYNRAYQGSYNQRDVNGSYSYTHTNLATSTSASIMGFVYDSASLSGLFSYGYFDMLDCQNTGKKKAIMGEYWMGKPGGSHTSFYGLAHVSHNTTTVPSSFEFSLSSGNIAAGSIIQLYGFKGY